MVGCHATFRLPALQLADQIRLGAASEKLRLTHDELMALGPCRGWHRPQNALDLGEIDLLPHRDDPGQALRTRGLRQYSGEVVVQLTGGGDRYHGGEGRERQDRRGEPDFGLQYQDVFLRLVPSGRQGTICDPILEFCTDRIDRDSISRNQF